MTQEQRVRAVISSTSSSLCEFAMHISVTYNSNDVFKCINKMTDEEFTAFTGQPVGLKDIYHTMMTSSGNDMAAELINMQFQFNIDKQSKELAALLETV